MIRQLLQSGETGPAQPFHDVVLDAQGNYTLDEAYAYCERIAHQYEENFPVASRFVPETKRRHICALYAFARTANNFVDAPAYQGRREALLADWEAWLDEASHGVSRHPIFIALRHTIRECSIPIAPLHDLLLGFSMDLGTQNYGTYAKLEQYLELTTRPIGRVMMYLFDHTDSALLRYADDLSVALGLTHLLQDVSADLHHGRLYLPIEDLEHFGLTEWDVRHNDVMPSSEKRDRLNNLIRYEVARARALYQRGLPVIDAVGDELGFELATIWQLGMALLDKIEGAGADVIRVRPNLNAAQKARLFALAARRRWPWSLNV